MLIWLTPRTTQDGEVIEILDWLWALKYVLRRRARKLVLRLHFLEEMLQCFKGKGCWKLEMEKKHMHTSQTNMEGNLWKGRK